MQPISSYLLVSVDPDITWWSFARTPFPCFGVWILYPSQHCVAKVSTNNGLYTVAGQRSDERIFRYQEKSRTHKMLSFFFFECSDPSE